MIQLRQATSHDPYWCIISNHGSPRSSVAVRLLMSHVYVAELHMSTFDATQKLLDEVWNL